MQQETPTKNINSMLKTFLEMGPVVLFFIAYLRLKDRSFEIMGTEYEGFIVVTAAFVILLMLTNALLYWLTGKLSKMQIFTLVIVVIFGGMTVWLNDPRFIKMKPTILYLLFGGILGFGLLRGQSYLQDLMEEAVQLRSEGWMILTKRVTIFFFALALLNEAVWRLSSTETWVYFKTFGLTFALFGFFMTQNKLFKTYWIEGDDNQET